MKLYNENVENMMPFSSFESLYVM